MRSVLLMFTDMARGVSQNCATLQDVTMSSLWLETGQRLSLYRKGSEEGVTVKVFKLRAQ